MAEMNGTRLSRQTKTSPEGVQDEPPVSLEILDSEVDRYPGRYDFDVAPAGEGRGASALAASSNSFTLAPRPK